MIHYHKFVEAFPDNKETGFPHAMCFKMPGFDELQSIQEIRELVKLPYPMCWFEGTGRTAVRGPAFGTVAFLAFDVKGFIEVGMYAYVSDGFSEMKHAVYDAGRGVWMQHVEDDKPPWPADIEDVVMGPNLVWLSRFLSLLNCSNIQRVENKPPEKLQRARIKRGRQPLFSFWTLVLGQHQQRSATPQGGTHASPRIHLRRGHIRKLENERHCWVQPCVVGNKDLGMVHKDYEVRTVQ